MRRNHFTQFFGRGECGQILPVALIIMAVGALLVGGFIASIGSTLLTVDVYSDPVPDNYTADAGIEDAIWGLQYGTLEETVETAGGTYAYMMPGLVNGQSSSITVTGTAGTGGGGGGGGGGGPGVPVTAIIAEDDFESGGYSGGYGWLDGWTHTGSTRVITSSSPYQGSYHVQLRGSNAYIDRSFDGTDYTEVKLTFWFKASSFEWTDTANLMVSADNTNWTTVQTWYFWDADDQYRYYEIDLSGFTMSSEFWIAFNSNVSSNNDYFYVDDIEITGTTISFDGGAVGVVKDYFESGDLSGGAGWLSPWFTSGDVQVTSAQTAYEGTYHMRMRDRNAYAYRTADLSEYSDVHLTFWSKVWSFENWDSMSCYVSLDGINWILVESWDLNDSDDQYHYHDFDLSGYTMTTEVWVYFYGTMSGAADYFYVDMLQYTGTVSGTPGQYIIRSVSGLRTTTAKVEIGSGNTTIVSWEIE